MHRLLVPLLYFALLAACQPDERPDRQETKVLTETVDAMSIESFRLANFADKTLQWELTAAHASLNRDQSSGNIAGVLIILKHEDGFDDSRIVARYGQISPPEEKVDLEGAVEILFPESGTSIRTEKMTFYGKEKKALSNQTVTIQTPDITVTGAQFEYLMRAGNLRLGGGVTAVIPSDTLVKPEVNQ